MSELALVNPLVSQALMGLQAFSGFVEMTNGVFDGAMELINNASELGSSFKSAFQQLTGSNYQDRVEALNTANPEQMTEVCQQLSDDIKRALAVVQKPSGEVASLPSICNGGGVQGCNEQFMTTTRASIERLENEMKSLYCQLQGKQTEKDKLTAQYGVCTSKLSAMNNTCMAAAATKACEVPKPLPPPCAPKPPSCEVPPPPKTVCEVPPKTVCNPPPKKTPPCKKKSPPKKKKVVKKSKCGCDAPPPPKPAGNFYDLVPYEGGGYESGYW